MLIRSVTIAGAIAADKLVIGIESIEVIAIVTGQHGEHPVGLHLKIAPIVRLAHVPNGRT